MTIIAYARVSTPHQKFDSQIEALHAYGVDYLYEEKGSGSNRDRPVLKQILSQLKKGDTFVIYKLDRLARGTQHLLQLIEYFDTNGIYFVSLENQIDTSTPTGKLLFTIMSAFAEMEATLIRERVMAGLHAARRKGVKLGRPSPMAKIEKALDLYQNSDLSVLEIIDTCDISAPTLYKYLNLKKIPLRGYKKTKEDPAF